jgi:hypothetical protein
VPEGILNPGPGFMGLKAPVPSEKQAETTTACFIGQVSGSLVDLPRHLSECDKGMAIWSYENKKDRSWHSLSRIAGRAGLDSNGAGAGRAQD